MFCIECGQELPATAKFCSNCGAKIISAKTPAQQPILDDIASKAVDIVVMDESPSFNDGGYTDDDVRKKADFFVGSGTNAPQSTTSGKNNSTITTSPNSRPAETKKYYGKYDYTDSFYEDLAVVRIGDWHTGKWGFIDRDGREVIPLKYSYAGWFSEGLADVCIRDGGTKKYGFIDKTGKEVIPFIYDYASRFREGLAKVLIGDWKTGKWGFIDREGKEAIPFIYDYAEDFANGLAKVKLEGKWGFIDRRGQKITSFIYDDAENFTNGLAKVKLDGKWGFIDRYGRKVTSFKYDDVERFTNGLAKVKLGGKWGLLDHTGNELLSIEYDEINNINIKRVCREDCFVRFKKGDKYGIIEYDKDKKCICKKVGCCLDSIGEFNTTADDINANIEELGCGNYVLMAKIRYHNIVYYIDPWFNIYEKSPLSFTKIPLLNKMFYDYIPSDMTWWKLK